MNSVVSRSSLFKDTTQSTSQSSDALSCEVDLCTSQQWGEIISGFDDATYDQSMAFLGDRWGHERLSSIVLRQGQEVVAAALLVILTLPVLNKGMAYLKMGPLWRRKGREADTNSLKLMVDAIKQEYSMRRGLMVMTLLPPDPDFGELAQDVMVDAGFKIKRKMSDPNRYLVNLKLNEEEQLQSLQQKWRYNLRKSLKNDFIITASNDEESLKQFMALYETMIARKGFNEHTPINGLKDLSSELPAFARPQFVIVEHDGKPTAGAVIGQIGGTASYLFGATDDRALPLKAGYAMQWWIINRLSQDQGVSWYDLGGEAMEPGLRQFKKGLTGKAGAIVTMPGEYETWNDPLSWLAAEGMTGLRSFIRTARKFDPKALHRWFGK